MQAAAAKTTKRQWLQRGLTLGVALACMPLVGFLVTALSMMHSFTALGGADVSDPHALGQSVGVSLVASAIGLALLPVGIILIVACWIALRHSQKPGAIPPSAPSTPKAG